jgi:hypothetical protein
MGFWSSLGGVALGVAGFATGQPALIKAGAGLLGSSIQASGNDKAVQQQVAAAEKAQGQTDAIYGQARGEMRDVYNQGQAGLAPYNALGQASLGNLGSMVGLKPVAAPAQAQQSQPYAPQSGTPRDCGHSRRQWRMPRATARIPTAARRWPGAGWCGSKRQTENSGGCGGRRRISS